MDGYEATRTIRALPREDVKDLQTIIAMTANAMELRTRSGLKNGMNAHIAQALDIGPVLQALAKYLGAVATQFTDSRYCIKREESTNAGT